MIGSILLVIRDKKGHIFGSFVYDELDIKPSYQGSNQSFLFSLHPQIGIFKPTNINAHFVYFNQNMSTLPNGLVYLKFLSARDLEDSLNILVSFWTIN